MTKQNENGVILYQDENGVTRVSVRFAGDDLWLTQNQIAEIYDTTQPNISMHLDGIYKDGELDIGATHQKFLLVQTVKDKIIWPRRTRIKHGCQAKYQTNRLVKKRSVSCANYP